MVCEQESKQGLIKISPAKSDTGLLESDSLLLLRWSLKTTPNHLWGPRTSSQISVHGTAPIRGPRERQRLCLLRRFPARVLGPRFLHEIQPDSLRAPVFP